MNCHCSLTADYNQCCGLLHRSLAQLTGLTSGLDGGLDSGLNDKQDTTQKTSQISNQEIADVASYTTSDSKFDNTFDNTFDAASDIKLAETAEQLMRSRYSAFVLADVDYIVQTTLPSQQSHLDKAAIKDWATATDWCGLEVVAHLAKLGKRHAQIEFKAFYQLAGAKHHHHELSTFVRATEPTSKRQLWYFIDPNALEQMQVSQKTPCICGSGDKFKRCCGKFV